MHPPVAHRGSCDGLPSLQGIFGTVHRPHQIRKLQTDEGDSGPSAMTAATMQPPLPVRTTPSVQFAGTLRADEGTRTLDLLHGKCERPFAPVRTRSVKRLDCGTFPRIERTRPHPSERRTLPFSPRKRTHRASGTVSSAACRSEAARTRSSARRIVGVSGSSSSESGFGGRARPKSASQLGSLSSAARGPRTRRRGERSP
jgi:hypothetical protein